MNPSRIVILVSVILMLSTKIGFGQKSYQPGYIITLGGDTLKGFIDYRNWDSNPKTINFKESENSEKKSYSPQDCRAFKVADEVYVSAHVPVEQTADLEVATPITQEDDVFLQMLFGGNKSLYYHKTKGGPAGFYINDQSSFTYLEYKKYNKKVGDQVRSAENKKFVGQLTLLLSDCPSISSSLSKVKYNKKSLEKLFNQYFNCIGSKPSFYRKTEKVSLQLGAIAGLSLTKLSFASSNSSFNYLTKPSFPVSNNFTGGFFADVLFSRNSGKWSFNNEVVFSSYSTNAVYVGYTSFGSYEVATKLANSLIKVNSMLRFKYPVKKAFIYINGGLSNGFSVSHTNSSVLTESSSVTYDGQALKDFYTYELDLLIGLGVKIGKFSFEIRHQNTVNGLNPVQLLESGASINSFLLGYRFK